MNGAKKHGVKRVVITSSMYSIIKDKDLTQRSFTTKDWSYDGPDQQNIYAKSKTLAERAAWKFLEDLPEAERFELAVICPGMVMGPTLVGGGFESGQIIKNVITGAWGPILAGDDAPYVDVRDIASAHLNAILKPEAAGKRFILAYPYPMNNIANDVWAIYSKEFPNCAHGEAAPSTLKYEFASEDTKNILGINWYDSSKTI